MIITMKQLFWAFLLALSILPLHLKAGITLHEASDATQTKAVLSASFSDLSLPHGFQYKYGTLPEIDGFSRAALASESDPVLVTTSGNAWSVREARGWVESYGGLAAGQSSTMSATAMLYSAATLTFDWSVDSEENIGILSFKVDGEEVASISGLVDFTAVSRDLAAGEHTFEWTYAKSSETNVGLDLGMVRNIHFRNTTPGEWIDVPVAGSEAQLDALYPGKDYLFRAYEVNMGYQYTGIKAFRTKEITFGSVQANPVTQTTATVVANVDAGDANVSMVLTVGEDRPDWREASQMLQYAFKEVSLPCTIFTSDKTYWEPGTDEGESVIFNDTGDRLGVNYPSFGVQVELAEPTTITFEWKMTGGNANNNVLYFKVDGETEAWTRETSGYETKTFQLPEGTHKILWDRNVYANGTAYVKNVQIGERPVYENTAKQYPFASPSTKITGLTPNLAYKGHVAVLDESGGLLVQSPWIYFTTLNVSADILEVTDVSQASATIHGRAYGGDATVVAAGLQYKDAAGDRWTDYPKDASTEELSQALTRLRPSTTYHYRAYIQAEGCDTVFSDTGEFTTLSVQALKPVTVRVAQHSAVLQGEVVFGDATIYQRGMQFRKAGTEEWEDVEDIGEEAVYTLSKTGLEMGVAYEARTYIQPAGGDVIYSESLIFATLDVYIGKTATTSTQTTLDMVAALVPLDEGVVADEYGFEYYADSDGFYMGGGATDLPSEVVRVPVEPEDEALHLHLDGLTPYYTFYYRAYVKIGGTYHYTEGYFGTDRTWTGAGTQRASIAVELAEITPTTALLKLDATQDGDAVVTQIEYGMMNLNQVVEEYLPCGAELPLEGLSPGTSYGLAFRGLVNGRWCPLLLSLDWDYSLYEFETLPLNIEVAFTDITQTKATMQMSFIFGNVEVRDLHYRVNGGEYIPCGEITDTHKTIEIEGLKPATEYYVDFWGIIGEETGCYWDSYYGYSYHFTTKAVEVSASAPEVLQTAATIEWEADWGDATFFQAGIEYGKQGDMVSVPVNIEESSLLVTELLPSELYNYRFFVETVEGGRVYSTLNAFITEAVHCETLPVSNVSNRSATLNGTIACDSYSSAEFGFQWKQMEGWSSEPAFTKGHKNDDGGISVGLVNGMLEPNTDYQYRAAVRYQGNIYAADEWETFRTESEYVYYPATVYTIFRTDRENNRLLLCGYYVAGSEEVVDQGYEYWNNSVNASARSTGGVEVIHTDASMQYSLDVATLQAGDYSVRAFVKTSSGITIYGNTLAFGVQGGEVVGISDALAADITCSVEGSSLTVRNATGLSCVVCNVSGMVVAQRDRMLDIEVFDLAPGLYVIRFSSGETCKVGI